MAKKLKLTRPELKRQRDQLHRFERYLPMLKLKQQQLQLKLREVQDERRKVEAAAEQANRKLQPYRPVLRDRAGLNVAALARPMEIRTTTVNIAGVNVPMFHDATFPQATYSLFATPAWVDRAIADMRDIARRQAELEVLTRRTDLLNRELTKITQRVNLFEKVRIPQARENIRRIRLQLGDEMTAGIARAKIAKGKLSEAGSMLREAESLGMAEAEAPQA